MKENLLNRKIFKAIKKYDRQEMEDFFKTVYEEGFKDGFQEGAKTGQQVDFKIEEALRDGDYDSIGGIVDRINNYGNSLGGFVDDYINNPKGNYGAHDWVTDEYPNGMSDIDYLKFISNGDKWEELRKQGSSTNKAEMDRLNAENNRLREKYGRNPNLGEYPKYHTGGWAYSEGLAVLQKDELVFPPDLSIGISKLFPLLSDLAKSNIGTESSLLTDNRKQIKIEKLLNIEKNYMEDDIDSEILVRQLQRSLTSL